VTLRFCKLDASDVETNIPIAPRFSGLKLHWFDDKPTTLEMQVLAEQFDISPQDLAYGDLVRLYQDSTCIFEGILTSIQPAKSLSVGLSFIDPSGNSRVVCQSEAWQSASQVGTKSRPRVVYNADPTDDDYSWATGIKVTVGQIIQDILSLNSLPLKSYRMSPASGDSWVQSELDALDIVPQSKIVFTQQSVRAAIESILSQFYYDKVLHWEPVARKWRIVDLASTTVKTVTLNKGDDPNIVLTGSFNRTIEGCYTAVSIRGPNGITEMDFTLGNGDLTDVSDSFRPQPGQFPNLYAMNKWQITNESDRVMTRTLATLGYAPSVLSTFGSPCNPQTGVNDPLWSLDIIETVVSPTLSPTLMVKFPSNNIAGGVWQTVEGVRFDFRAGIVSTGEVFPHRWNPCPPAPGGVASPNWENPIDVRLYTGVVSVPLEVRSPASGYAGTAYSIAGVQDTKVLYAEELSVHYADGINYTTPERLAAFQKIADQLLKHNQDIHYAGVVTLNGIAIDWLTPSRLCIAALDLDGQPIDTGMEAANARVTEVELDIEEGITTITYNSGWMAEADLDKLKSRMQFRALSPFTNLVGTSFQNMASTVKSGMTGRHITKFTPSYGFEFQSGFVDQVTGEVQGLVRNSLQTNVAGVSWDPYGRVL
jgi:hypothetical protein